MKIKVIESQNFRFFYRPWFISDRRAVCVRTIYTRDKGFNDPWSVNIGLVVKANSFTPMEMTQRIDDGMTIRCHTVREYLFMGKCINARDGMYNKKTDKMIAR